MRVVYLTITTGLMLALVGSLHAQAPRTMSFQGFATDPTGTAIDTPGVAIQFTLYVAGTETDVWMETHPTVAVDSGLFNVELGGITPIDARFHRGLDLGIKVGDDSEMPTRISLASSPYAMGLALPVYGTGSTDTTALGVVQQGDGDGLSVHTGGLGTPGVFIVDNSGNDHPAVHAETNGVGPALFARSTGEGNAAVFAVDDVGSASPAVYITTNGTGMGLLSADSVHIRTTSLGLDSSERRNEELLIEASDAMMGLYSDGVGTYGSGIHLGEIVANDLVDKWSIVRTRNGVGSFLTFRYGTTGNHENHNPTLAGIDTLGNLTMRGYVKGGEMRYTVPRPHYAAVPFDAFKPLVSDSTTSYEVLGGLYLTKAATFTVTAGVQLPDEAVIDSLACWMVDLHGTVPGSDLSCTLLRYDASSNSVATIASVQTAGAPGTVHLAAAATPAFATVDNHQYSYSIEVAATGKWTNSNLLLRSAHVRYTLSEAQ